MENCCHPTYQKVFDDKVARKELKSYLKKGVKKSTRPLLDSLTDLDIESSSLLDIGGGIGVISFELFKRGLAHSTQVDISKAYLQTFEAEAQSRNLSEKVNTYLGDFVDHADEIPMVDLVTLDKVICCYEFHEDLIKNSVAKARRWYAYTLPKDAWWVRWGNRIGYKIVRLFGIKFQSFVHPVDEIEQWVREAGFRKIESRTRIMWMTVLFEKEIINRT